VTIPGSIAEWPAPDLPLRDCRVDVAEDGSWMRTGIQDAVILPDQFVAGVAAGLTKRIVYFDDAAFRVGDTEECNFIQCRGAQIVGVELGPGERNHVVNRGLDSREMDCFHRARCCGCRYDDVAWFSPLVHGDARHCSREIDRPTRIHRDRRSAQASSGAVKNC